MADVQAAEEAGFTSIWIPQIPGYLDALTAIAIVGQVTERIEIGTAVVPIQTRHPVAMAQQALTTQVACGGRFTLGLGPSHHWIVQDQLGLPYERPAHLVRNYLEVLNRAFARAGSARRRQRRVPGAQPDGRRRRHPDAGPHLRARLRSCCASPVSTRPGPSSGWPTSGRSANTWSRALTKAASEAGRPAPRVVAGVPVALCADGDVDAARVYASDVLGHADFSPNYERLIEHGDAEDVGDTMAAGSESAIVERLRRYRDAGVTDLAARIVPLGDDAATRLESRRRTQAFLATLCPEL